MPQHTVFRLSFADEGPHDDNRIDSTRSTPSNRQGNQVSRNNILLPGSYDSSVHAGEREKKILHHAHGDREYS